MYFYYILNNFPLKNISSNKSILFILFILFVFENYVSYNEHTNVLNEFYLNLVFKLLNIVSNIDVNLILILILILILNWFYFRSNTIYVKLTIIFIFYEKEIFGCLYKGGPLFTPINTNLLNGLFFLHPIILILLITLFYGKVTHNFKFNLNLNLKLGDLHPYKQNVNSVLLMLSVLLLFTGG